MQFLTIWLEIQLDEKINWRNNGKYFQIDHVNPRSLYVEDGNNRKLINHCSNLQALDKYENM